jgi:hypothetical protein
MFPPIYAAFVNGATPGRRSLSDAKPLISKSPQAARDGRLAWAKSTASFQDDVVGAKIQRIYSKTRP